MMQTPRLLFADATTLYDVTVSGGGSASVQTYTFALGSRAVKCFAETVDAFAADDAADARFARAQDDELSPLKIEIGRLKTGQNAVVRRLAQS